MQPEGPANVLALSLLGQTLSGKYELLRLLGEGGMAYVFEAKHIRLKQRVAIKVLSPELAAEPEIVARFEHEARAVAQLRTPHVARVMDVDVTVDGLPFIVMEFLEGRDLDGELAARGRLPVDEAVDYVIQASAAMIEAHENGIIHRDLKPANLFLAMEAEQTIVKVLDFGISKVLGEATKLTAAGAVMGTVLYMSPEQVRASKDVDARADIWSLGVILFELIAGRPPWTGSSPQIAASIVSNDAPDVRSFVQVPDPLANVLRSTLSRDVLRRPATMRVLVSALGPYARPGSVGGIIAEQVSLGGTNPRVRAIAKGHAVKSVTVPLQKTHLLSGLPAAPSSSPSSPQATPSSSPVLAPPLMSSATAPMAPSATARARGSSWRTSAIIGAAIGLVGALVIALFTAWYLKRTPQGPPHEPVRSRAPSPSAAPLIPTSAAPSSPSSSSAAAVPSPGAPSPMTGTATGVPAKLDRRSVPLPRSGSSAGGASAVAPAKPAASAGDVPYL